MVRCVEVFFYMMLYSLVEADLKDDKQVMFTGTPCQCEGVSLYLEKRHINKENLLLVDIICHGVPSPKLWRSNISWIENKYQGKIAAVNFRNKKFGWNSHIETYNIGDKEYQSEIFKNIFYSNVCLRPSCYECDYASLQRKTDITIGDAWRSDNNYVTSNMGGESLIIVSSQKGMKEIEKLNAAQSESTGNRCQPVWRDSRYIGCTATCKRKRHNHNGNRQCGRQQYCP